MTRKPDASSSSSSRKQAAAVAVGGATSFLTFEDSLQECDSETTFAGISKAFQRHVIPRLESLLRLPLKQRPDPSVAPSEFVHDSIASARRVVSAYDDVKYLTMQCVTQMLKSTVDTTPAQASRQPMRRAKRGERSEDTETLLTNVFCLLYGIKLSSAKSEDAVSLRWACLGHEKRAVERSEAYANSNAVERRAMQLKTVLAIFSDRGRRHEFSGLWTAFTSSAEVPSALRVHFLTSATTHILPFLTRPVALADYCTTCVAAGGLTAVLALGSLFHLMINEGLEYPSFYDKLYSLVTADAFSTKHRHQLFNLIDIALKSTRLSAEIVAAFIKRIARVLLLAPAPSLYFSLPFLRQLFQRHPNCIALIHRTDGDAALFEGVDPYDPFATTIAKSRAIESTLWELCALERHFMPAVGLMVAAYASPAQDTGALKLDKTYGRLFAQEVTRGRQEEAAGVVAYKAPEADLLAEGHKEPGIAGVFTA